MTSPRPYDEEQYQLAAVAMQAPRLPWDRFRQWWEWEQGEHVGLIGPTGQGKTTLLLSILDEREYVVVFSTKPFDETMDGLIESDDYDRYAEWIRTPATKSPKRVLWPDASEIDADNTQRLVFDTAFRTIYRERNWCLVIDEGSYVAEQLKLKQPMRMMWTQARSLGISFVVGTQRPAWVPVEMYDGSTHLFFWRTQERAAVQRISGLGSANSDLVRWVVPRLDPHEALYVNTRTGEMRRTKAPRPLTVVSDDTGPGDTQPNR